MADGAGLGRFMTEATDLDDATRGRAAQELLPLVGQLVAGEISKIVRAVTSQISHGGEPLDAEYAVQQWIAVKTWQDTLIQVRKLAKAGEHASRRMREKQEKEHAKAKCPLPMPS